MNPFDDIEPPFKQELSRGDRKTTPPPLVRTVDGPEPAPDWPRGHVPPPKPYVPARHPNGQLMPGHTSNINGRPPSFGKLIRHYSADGLELVAFAFGLLRGEITNEVVTKEGDVIDVEASSALKFEVIKWLKDQGFGKEVARIDVTSNGETVGAAPVEDTPDITKLSTQELREYLALRRKMLASKPSGEQVVDAEPVRAVPSEVQGVAALVTIFPKAGA